MSPRQFITNNEKFVCHHKFDKMYNKIVSKCTQIYVRFFLFLADFRRNAAPSVIFQGTERPGCCVEPVTYQVRNDNVAEPDEILTISIAWSISSAAIPVQFVVQQVNVTIIDNDSEWVDE